MSTEPSSQPQKKTKASKATEAEATDSGVKVFEQERTHLIAAFLILGIMIIAVGAAPLYLAWFLIIPIAFIWWIFKSKTIVDDSGITAQYAFAGNKTAAWDSIEGIGFERSKAFVKTTDGNRFNLPAITFNSLPALEEASAGRIPDVLTRGRWAADEKVVVVNRDGRQVLMTKEEFAEYEKEHGPVAGAHSDTAAAGHTPGGEAAPGGVDQPVINPKKSK